MTNDTTSTGTSQTESTGRIPDPVHRSSYCFRRDGENLWVETWLQDGAHLPEHFHPSLEERWEIVEGAVQLKLDGHWRELTPEDGSGCVGRNAKHELKLKNTSGREAHALTKVLPAGGLEEFLTESARAARDGVFNAGGLPTSLRGAIWVAAFAQRFRHETVMTSPPPALQRLILPVLGRFAR